MVRKLLAALCLLALLLCCACGNANKNDPSSSSVPASSTRPKPAGHVRYANPNPALQEAWEAIAADYTEKTGVPVTILSPDKNTGMTPTLFTVDDETQLAEVSDICLDLAGEKATHHIQNWNLTLYENGKMCGLPLEVEGYGLIYNVELLRKVGITAADITSFEKLTEVVKNIATNSKTLKFKPFACVDLNTDAISLLGTLPGDIRPFWDLYTANTACKNITADDDGPMMEMADWEAAFCIGSTREFEALAAMSEGVFNIMPLYFSSEAGVQQGLCVRVENYLCVRSDVAKTDIAATLDFLDYLTHPEDEVVAIDGLEIFTPYSTAKYYASALEKTLRDHISLGKPLLVFSSINAPEGLSDALKTYAAAPTDENWAMVAEILG